MHGYVCNVANQKYYGGWLGNLRRYTQNWLKRQMLKQVHELDDYLIKDLGMNRQEIADVLQLPLIFDPILELHRRSRAKAKRIGASPTSPTRHAQGQAHQQFISLQSS
jgi:uncharacterized protein YjiS (DUF1127 family)